MYEASQCPVWMSMATRGDFTNYSGRSSLQDGPLGSSTPCRVVRCRTSRTWQALWPCLIRFWRPTTRVDGAGGWVLVWVRRGCRVIGLAQRRLARLQLPLQCNPGGVKAELFAIGDPGSSTRQNGAMCCTLPVRLNSSSCARQRFAEKWTWTLGRPRHSRFSASLRRNACTDSVVPDGMVLSLCRNLHGRRNVQPRPWGTPAKSLFKMTWCGGFASIFHPMFSLPWASRAPVLSFTQIYVETTPVQMIPEKP